MLTKIESEIKKSSIDIRIFFSVLTMANENHKF